MPPLPNVPNVLKSILLHGIGTGQDLVNIFFWEYSGISTVTNLEDVATAIKNAWHTDILPLLSEHVTLNEVTVEDLTSNTSPVGIISDGTSGSDTSSSLPNSAAALVSHEISRRYRGGHPRTYFGTVGESKLVSANTWDPTFISSLTIGMANLHSAVVGFSMGGITITDMVNVSYRSGNAPRVTPVTDSVLSFEGRPRVCSQRRRLGKAGG